MKSIAVTSVLLGLALANPVQKRQDFDTDAYSSLVSDAPLPTAPVGDAAPQLTVTVDADALIADAIATIADGPAPTPTGGVAPDTTDAPSATTDDADADSVEKRAACVTRTYNGPRVTVPADTPEAFLNYAPFHATATAAAKSANIPKGYALIPGFVDLSASVKGGDYLTYTSSKLTSYNLQTCADLCDNKVDGCVAFNIFYERVPLIIDPTTHTTNKNTCPGLATSPSATLIKCDFFGKAIFPGMATNTGQAEQDFHFVKAGSNAYIQSKAPSVDGYNGPVSFGDATINAPAPVGAHGFIRTQTFGTNVPFSPQACGDACDASSAYNLAHGKAPCVFFDVFVLYLNGANGVLSCNLYSVAYDETYATNVGRHDNSGNHWTPSMSYGYYKPGVPILSQ